MVLPAHLLGDPQRRRRRAQRAAEQEGEGRPAAEDPRQPPRADPAGRCREHRRRHGAQAGRHRRHALRRQTIPILLEHIESYEPVISRAIEPGPWPRRTSSTSPWARSSTRTRPSWCREDEETGQTLISGMGELHLDIIVDRLLREYNVEARVGKPQVVYRETVTSAGEAECDLRAQAGGARSWSSATPRCAWSRCRAAPGPASSQRCPPSRRLPPAVVEAAMEGLKEAATGGVNTGFPLVDIKVTLLGVTTREGRHQRRWATRWPRGRPSAAPAARPSRRCSSRSWTWR